MGLEPMFEGRPRDGAHDMSVNVVAGSEMDLVAFSKVAGLALEHELRVSSKRFAVSLVMT